MPGAVLRPARSRSTMRPCPSRSRSRTSEPRTRSKIRTCSRPQRVRGQDPLPGRRRSARPAIPAGRAGALGARLSAATPCSIRRPPAGVAWGLGEKIFPMATAAAWSPERASADRRKRPGPDEPAASSAARCRRPRRAESGRAVDRRARCRGRSRAATLRISPDRILQDADRIRCVAVTSEPFGHAHQLSSAVKAPVEGVASLGQRTDLALVSLFAASAPARSVLPLWKR